MIEYGIRYHLALHQFDACVGSSLPTGTRNTYAILVFNDLVLEMMSKRLFTNQVAAEEALSLAKQSTFNDFDNKTSNYSTSIWHLSK